LDETCYDFGRDMLCTSDNCFGSVRLCSSVRSVPLFDSIPFLCSIQHPPFLPPSPSLSHLSPSGTSRQVPFSSSQTSSQTGMVGMSYVDYCRVREGQRGPAPPRPAASLPDAVPPGLIVCLSACRLSPVAPMVPAAAGEVRYGQRNVRVERSKGETNFNRLILILIILF
jgi:hypothetical protein